MIEAVQNIARIPDLRKRLLFVALMMFVFRVGAHIHVPGIDWDAIMSIREAGGGGLLDFLDMFSGQALSQVTIFALGIMPYISASIILQLLTVVVPYLEKLSKEGELGRKKITQYTRYGTVLISIIQGYGMTFYFESLQTAEGSIFTQSAANNMLWWKIMTVITLTAGTAFIMWIGEQISDRGIGNGISLLIFAGIVAGLPGGVVMIIQDVMGATERGETAMTPFKLILLLIFMVAVVGAIVFVERGQRRIPVSYAKRVRLMFSGHAYTPDLTYLIKLHADSPAAYDVQIMYAFLNYRFIDEFQVKAGVFQLVGTRAGFNSSANMQFVEYPVTEAVFGTGTGVGVRFWGQLYDKKLEYFLDVVNSINGTGNRTITADPAEMDNNPAIAFRAVWHACGDVPTRDFVSWADIEHKTMPCVDLGFNYVFNDDDGDTATTRIPFVRNTPTGGAFGLTSTNGVQVNHFGLDAAFKYQGFSLSGEYMLRLLDVRRGGRTPFAPLWQLTADDATTAMHGGYVQAGYFLPIPGHEKKIEAVARVGGITTNAGPGGAEGTWVYAAGLNYYFQGNKVKLQTDVTRVDEVPTSANSWLANVNDGALIWRVQLQVAF